MHILIPVGPMPWLVITHLVGCISVINGNDERQEWEWMQTIANDWCHSGDLGGAGFGRCFSSVLLNHPIISIVNWINLLLSFSLNSLYEALGLFLMRSWVCSKHPNAEIFFLFSFSLPICLCTSAKGNPYLLIPWKLMSTDQVMEWELLFFFSSTRAQESLSPPSYFFVVC